MNKYCKLSTGLLFCLLVCISSCFHTKTCMNNDETNWIMSDSIVTKHLTGGLTDILSFPDSIKCYSLIYKIDKNSKGYVRDTLLAVLDNKQIAILQYLIIGNPQSYKIDSMKIEAPNIPIIEYEFWKKDSLSASVIISTSDRSWSLLHKNKKIFEYTYGDASAVERFCNYFFNMCKLKNEKK